MPIKSFLPIALLMLLFGAVPATAATLPGNLVASEIENIVQTVGFAATMRLMRSAEAYQSWPGLKLGVEMGIGGNQDIGSFGNGQANVPGLLLTPRIYLAKGLFSDIELILGIMPFDSPMGITANGGIGKWNFYREREGWLSGCAYLAYTHIRAFQNVYDGNNVEFGVSFSKDFVRLKPYIGAGILYAEGGVLPTYAATAVQSVLQSTLHTFIGFEWEMPVNFTFQLDLMNLTPMGSILVGKKF